MAVTASIRTRGRSHWRDGIVLEPATTGLEAPVYLTAPPGEPRLFVVERPGHVRLSRGGRLLPRPYPDISAKVDYGGERRLLGLSFHFHPHFA